MTKESITYSEAIAQVEDILQKFNNEHFDVDRLAVEVKRATELITLCKTKLLKAEKEVNKILNKVD